MLARLIGRQAGRQSAREAVPADGLGPDIRRFELLSAMVAGASVMVFVDPQGVATAVETTDDGTHILTGIAAGAALSDVREAAEFPSALPVPPRSVTAPEAAALVASLQGLNAAQRGQLLNALSL
jgi:hypothetical protein